MENLHREVWEGWTARDFIYALSDEIESIMTRRSWRKPFATKRELIDYIVDHQPYYKKPIPEVNDYFAARYGLS